VSAVDCLTWYAASVAVDGDASGSNCTTEWPGGLLGEIIGALARESGSSIPNGGGGGAAAPDTVAAAAACCWCCWIP
jgi:hypothetical protein